MSLRDCRDRLARFALRIRAAGSAKCLVLNHVSCTKEGSVDRLLESLDSWASRRDDIPMNPAYHVLGHRIHLSQIGKGRQPVGQAHCFPPGSPGQPLQLPVFAGACNKTQTRPSIVLPERGATEWLSGLFRGLSWRAAQTSCGCGLRSVRLDQPRRTCSVRQAQRLWELVIFPGSQRAASRCSRTPSLSRMTPRLRLVRRGRISSAEPGSRRLCALRRGQCRRHRPDEFHPLQHSRMGVASRRNSPAYPGARALGLDHRPTRGQWIPARVLRKGSVLPAPLSLRPSAFPEVLEPPSALDCGARLR
jgi:hypothetical protein